jgi:transposase
MRSRRQSVTGTGGSAVRTDSSHTGQPRGVSQAAGQALERSHRTGVSTTTSAVAFAPKVVALRGVGIHTTATLLVTAGDNPDRLRSEGAFARLTGTAPIPASSGQTDRFRLSRGGDRQANAALHLIAVNRLLCDPRSKAYVKKRTGGTKANLDILRRLKRYTPESSTP